MSLTHIFGELDLDLSKDFMTIFEKCFDISEACGYFPNRNNNKTEIVKDPVYFWLMQQPQPLFLLGILGMIFCAIFSIKLYFLREFTKI